MLGAMESGYQRGKVQEESQGGKNSGGACIPPLSRALGGVLSHEN